jgi:hypothetical protein
MDLGVLRHSGNMVERRPITIGEIESCSSVLSHKFAIVDSQ